MRQNGLPTTRSMMHIFFDENNCIDWLIEQGVLKSLSVCTECSGNITGKGKNIRCTRNTCRKRYSIVGTTFFALSRLECCEVLYIGYLWLANCTSDVIRHQTGHSTGTITAYCRYYRQLIASAIETDDELIGGEDIVIQIDETKMGIWLTKENVSTNGGIM